jgi:hypothetical protein
LCREVGKTLTKAVVGGVVQPNAVLLALRPAVGSDGVEAFGVLVERLQESVRLLAGRIQPKPNRALHIYILPLPARGGKAALLPMAEARGLRATSYVLLFPSYSPSVWSMLGKLLIYVG